MSYFPKSSESQIDYFWDKLSFLKPFLQLCIDDWEEEFRPYFYNPSSLKWTKKETDETLIPTPTFKSSQERNEEYHLNLYKEFNKINQKLDQFSSYWKVLSQSSRSVVQMHTLKSIACLLVNPLYQSLSSENICSQDQNTLLWALLFHDIEKEIPLDKDGNHRRDPFHPFRSGPSSLRELIRIFELQADKKKLDDWEELVISSFIIPENQIPIHDNSRLPLILKDLNSIIENSHPLNPSTDDQVVQSKKERIEFILWIILLHQSFPALDKWPNCAVLDDPLIKLLFMSRTSDDEVSEDLKWTMKPSTSLKFFKLKKIFAMSDSLTYDMFRPSLSYYYQGEINLNFNILIERVQEFINENKKHQT